jgi:diguanylate cyclase (GGDEF)-like protein
MTSRVLAGLAGLFRPAAALLGRLRYAQKFMVVGLVLLIPLGVTAGAYIDLQRGQMVFSEKERLGVELMAPLIGLTDQAVRARHLAVTGGADATVDLLAEAVRIDAVQRRVSRELDIGPAWRVARSMLLDAWHGTGSAAVRYERYNVAIDGLLAFIVLVGDESNLTLDPDLDTYYLMDTLQFRLPVVLDMAGRSVDRAVLARTDSGEMDTDVYIDLGLENGVLSSTRTVISRAARTIADNTADPQVRRATRGRFAALDHALADLDEVLTAAVKGRQAAAVPENAADEVRRAAAQFAAESADGLDRLLRTRIDRFSVRSHQVGIGTALAALLAVYLFVGFYLSVARPIRRIVGTLHAVAGGDLGRRVSVDTHDELSFVARALNDTVAKTEGATHRLAVQATHDTLTGLPNRALAMDRLQQALSRTARTGRLMAVFFVDLDGFKIINDSLGHAAGDDVLCEAGSRLTGMVRASDTVARFAGDEFVVISEELGGVDAALALGERIVEALSGPITTTGSGAEREVGIGASVGIALTDGSTSYDPDQLLCDADVAMYRAKQRGRGRVEVFDDVLRVALESQLEVQDDLRRALDSGELRVHYQPIVDTRAGRIIGFEALVRWQHPTRGLLSAADFIGVAEESGLVVPLGAYVLHEACRQAARWRATRPGGDDLHIAINVSGPQFGHPSFVPAVAAALADTGLDADALWLEITETSIMADAGAAQQTLDAIRALGVHLAIDDFGTGYSSLAYLRRFPVSVLKIDRSFVAGLGRDREDEAIVSMIVSLARTLDLRIVAEGVENATQTAQLRRLGGDILLQGYHFGRPAPPERAWDVVGWGSEPVPAGSH